MGEDFFSYGVLFLSSLLLVILLGFFFTTPRKNKRLPPSPPAFPIIGHLHLLGKSPHRSLNQIAKQYGPIMLLKFGARPTAIASTPEMAMEFLKIHDRRFASRASVLGSRILLYNDQDVAFAEGEHWKLMRKFLTMELLTPKRLVDTQQIRREEILSMVEAITDLSSQGKEIDASNMIHDCSLNIIGRIVIGKRIVQGAPLSELFKEFATLLEEVNISDFIPQLWWLDLKGYEKRLKSLHAKLDSFLADILLEHRQRRPTNETGYYIPDFVDALLDTSIDGIKLEEDQIKAMILDAFLGGTQTASATLEWALSELLNAPSTLHKAQEELDQIVGIHGVLEESCLDNLKYLKAIVKETLRLHPPAPMLIPHKALEDCIVAGYEINKGTRVMVNVWAIGQDPRIWDIPLEFAPDRFLKSNIDVKGQDFELIPFGSGRRACPGLSMGMRMLEIILAHLLYAFSWKVPQKGDVNMEEAEGLTTKRAEPLIALALPRKSDHG